MKNAYPELPELPYLKTKVSEALVIEYIESRPLITEVKRAAWILFAIESGHGKKGVCNNYVGAQADGNRLASRWDVHIVGTCITPENMTGQPRRFVCFDSWKASVDFVINAVVARGMYVGGMSHPYSKNMPVKTPTDAGRAYWKEWVTGSNTEPPQSELDDFISLYKTASGHFK